jgi:RNA polymerase sigma-70 factor (ECF subfamily)
VAGKAKSGRFLRPPQFRVPEEARVDCSVAPKDSALVEGLRAHNPAALDELANSYGELLFHIAQRITGSTSDADDVVQETLLRAWKSVPAAGPVHLRAWLVTVTTRLALNELRRQRRHPVMPLPADSRPDAARQPRPSTLTDQRPGYDPYKATAAHLSETDALRALASLPGTLRAAMVLRAVHGLEYTEIAAALGCSVGAARVKVYRARQFCARALLGAEPVPSGRAGCARLADRIVAWAEGELNADEAAELEAHVASCSYCQRARERVETAKSAWGLLPLLAWEGKGKRTALELINARSPTGRRGLGRAWRRRALMGERDRHVLTAFLTVATAGAAVGASFAALHSSKPAPGLPHPPPSGRRPRPEPERRPP